MYFSGHVYGCKEDRIVNATKHIEEIAGGDLHLQGLLRDLRGALLHNRYYTWGYKVTESSTVHYIRFGYITRNKLHSVRHPAILKLAGLDGKGRIRGGGMDMLYETQMTLFDVLCPDKSSSFDMSPYNKI